MSPVQAFIDIVAIFGAVYAWRSLPPGKLRWLFVTSFLLMAVAKIYDPNTDSREVLWVRHVPVYIGEVLFYYFIVVFGKQFIEMKDAVKKPRTIVLKQNLLVLLPLTTSATGIAWFQYVTDQGLPHVFVLPIFVLVLSLVRLRLAMYETKYLLVVKLFTIGVFAWTLLHVSEFFIESQKLMPSLSEHMWQIELFWYCLGVSIFWYALKLFKDLRSDQKN